MSKHLMTRLACTLALALAFACNTPSGEPLGTGRVVLLPLGDPVLESDAPVGSIAVYVSPEGRQLVLHGGAAVRWAATDPGGRFVATVGLDSVLIRTEIDPRVPAVAGLETAARSVVEEPVFDPLGSGALLVAVTQPGSEGNALVLVQADGQRRTIAAAGSHNERAVFSPDATRIAFVSDISSVPSVWVQPLGGSPPVQLTNVGIERVPGRPPAGYLPPPASGALAWTPSGIEYDSAQGHVLIDPDGPAVTHVVQPASPSNPAGEVAP